AITSTCGNPSNRYPATATYDIERSCEVSTDTTNGDDKSISESSSVHARMFSSGNGPSTAAVMNWQRFSVLNTCSGIPSLPPAPTSAAFEAIDSSVTKTVPLASGCPNEGIACAQPSRSQISHSGAADHSNNPNLVLCLLANGSITMSTDSTCSSQSPIRIQACFRRPRKTSDFSVPAFDTAIVCDEYRAFVVFVNADQASQSRCCRNSSNARSVTDNPRPPSSEAASPF